MIVNINIAWLLLCQLSACWDTKILMACLHCPHWTAHFRREGYVDIARSQIDDVRSRIEGKLIDSVSWWLVRYLVRGATTSLAGTGMGCLLASVGTWAKFTVQYFGSRLTLSGGLRWRCTHYLIQQNTWRPDPQRI